MATGWNYMWGESWHEYLQRSTITNDLTTAQQESSRAMIGAISEETASILTGIESSTRVLQKEFMPGFLCSAVRWSIPSRRRAAGSC
jgi:hypothetical protein